MKKITYPILCYSLGEKGVLGLLVGTNYQLVENDMKSLKNSFLTYIKKDYKKLNYYVQTGIVNPKLKLNNVKVRPYYETPSGVSPGVVEYKISLPIIYGEFQEGGYKAYIPTFNRSFLFQRINQLNTLSSYLGNGLLAQLSPSKLMAELSRKTPFLEELEFRVNPNRNNSSNWSWEPNIEKLQKIAVLLPEPKKVSKKGNRFLPEVAWELEDKVNELTSLLGNENHQSILIVGESGTGKSILIKNAIRLVVEAAKKNKSKQSFWKTQANQFVKGAKYLGEWQENVEEIIEELDNVEGTLWVADFAQLLKIGGQGPADSIASFLTDPISQGELSILGEMTPTEFESNRRLLPDFFNNFKIILLPTLPDFKVFKVMDQYISFINQKYGITIDAEAKDFSYRLLKRFYPYEFFPGKVIRFLSRTLIQMEAKNLDQTMTGQTVVDNFSQETGMPAIFLRDDLLLDGDRLQSFFEGKIIGQEEAISTLCNTIRIFKAGLNNPDKPIATLVFAGPTGVGKTASAKALAEYFFGNAEGEKALIRIDMSEFQHPSQIYRFIGTEGNPSKLIQGVREKPFSVLLLDEVEKADKSIFDTFLSVLDEGRMTDRYGRVTNFRNTIIILTTNLGAKQRNAIGNFNQTSSDLKQNYLSAIKDFFRPEFVNRIDGIVAFNQLNEADISKIAIKELKDLSQLHGVKSRNINLQFSPSLITEIVKRGFDEKLGARPLQRAIDREIVSPLSKWMNTHHKIKNKELNLSWKDELVITIIEK